MRARFLRSTTTLAIVGAALVTVIWLSITATSAQAPAAVPMTSWGEPDLQGIWTDETDPPLQRSPRFGTQEFFTEAERVDLDQQRSAMMGRDKRAERGSIADVAGAYNDAFTPKKRTGLRTSRIVDPENGRLPPTTAEAQKIAAAERDFRLILLQATEACKNNDAACRGGKYDPKPSARYDTPPPRYNTATINRYKNPEDASLAVRCRMGGAGVPEVGNLGGVGDRISFRRIVQTPNGITMFYDVGQGQGWQRNIVMDGSPHLPASVRQWYGDSRGHWEGNTLVIDVTNFSPKTDFQGSRENLHLVERFTRTGPTTLGYEVTIAAPTVWTRPWTVKQEFSLQSNEDNRIYPEPRCVEGNYGLPGLLHGRRTEDREYAEGRGPHPATKDNVTGTLTLGEVPQDPLLQ